MNQTELQLTNNTSKLEESKENILSIIDFQISHLRSSKFQSLLKNYQKNPFLDKQIQDLENERKKTIDQFKHLTQKLSASTSEYAQVVNQ